MASWDGGYPAFLVSYEIESLAVFCRYDYILHEVYSEIFEEGGHIAWVEEVWKVKIRWHSV